MLKTIYGVSFLPLHPRLKNVIVLFKENERFK
jgi:hypothetical protein